MRRMSQPSRKNNSAKILQDENTKEDDIDPPSLQKQGTNKTSDLITSMFETPIGNEVFDEINNESISKMWKLTFGKSTTEFPL